ncbi:M48 family metalloprotease [Azospirillum picis]|uniref:Zn-dependent protease n=1 Tax=Azospirillum picis TaxID=488438 RepID=A0ABU0MLB2_9PROT|nr:M48 family metalloprotease [Azospirillum picis]MBP2300464.1 putative Zn-dependent protease [Azospirillum picis]MDQ0534260.1 putative Zn-dependent protease [Azospirillum picis]
MPTSDPIRKPFRKAAGALAALWLAATPVLAVPAPAMAGLLDGTLFGGGDAALGAQEHPKILAQFGGEVKNPRLTAYVGQLGRRLAATTDLANEPWTFTVLDSDVVNAFALPGGYVYITRGLLALAQDEAEVAGVLAHEIGHVTAHHSAQRMTRETIAGLVAAGVGAVFGSDALAQIAGLGGTALVASYSREQELEADRLGVATLERAGYDPFAMATFLETLRRDGQYEGLRAGGSGSGSEGFDFLASHPATEERVRVAADLARSLPPGGARPRDPYLAAVDGMIYGDSPENGYVRGRSFAHPQLGIAFTVPQGYALLNGADQVVAKGPNGVAMAFDGGSAAGQTDPAAFLTGVWGKGAALSNLERVTIDGMPAATATTRGEANGGSADVRLAAIRMPDGRIYRFTFLAPAGTLARYDADFKSAAMSFHRLTAQEAGRYQPRRVQLVTVRPGDTVEGFVRRMPQETYAEELFRIINNIPPGNPLEPGRRVKLIVGG